MEEKRRTFAAFLALHAHKADVTDEPVAHLLFEDGGFRGTDTPLVAFTVEHVMAELDTDAELVRWLLHQMSTYEPTRERIVGLVFDKQTVLSEVLRVPRR